MAGNGGKWASCVNDAIRVEENATSAPTDRSMPPERLTKVIPTAHRPRKALSVKRLVNTRNEKNALYWSPPRQKIATKTNNVARSGTYLRLTRSFIGSPSPARARRAACGTRPTAGG